MTQDRMRGSLAGGIILIVLGAIFLAAQVLEVNLWQYCWPLMIVLPGAMFLVGMATGGRSASGLAIPGCIITAVGLILLYQNIFNHWESWAYAWALIPAAVGLGLIIHGKRSETEEPVKVGRFLVGLGIVLFLSFGAFFELLIGLSGRRGLVWPLVMIGVGLYFLLGGPGLGTCCRPPAEQRDDKERQT